MPRLITVSGKHIDLVPGCRYVLGRDAACDVVVEDCSCSRRHAKITVSESGDETHLEDLKSRNGTYLNGTILREPMRIPAGGQIRVGSTIFVVTFDEVAVDDSPETREMNSSETLFLEALPPGRSQLPLVASPDSGIAVYLASISLLDVLQILKQMGRSGKLQLDFKDDQASVEIRGGEILAAAYRDSKGLTALHQLVGRTDGRFHFVENDEPVERNIESSTQEILLEICRRLDESTIIGPLKETV